MLPQLLIEQKIRGGKTDNSCTKSSLRYRWIIHFLSHYGSTIESSMIFMTSALNVLSVLHCTVIVWPQIPFSCDWRAYMSVPLHWRTSVGLIPRHVTSHLACESTRLNFYLIWFDLTCLALPSELDTEHHYSSTPDKLLSFRFHLLSSILPLFTVFTSPSSLKQELTCPLSRTRREASATISSHRRLSSTLC